MILRANAKLNLSLFVTGTDPSDGYHTLDSIFQEISWSDHIKIRSAERDIIYFVGSDIEGDSTVHKALRLFKQASGLKQNFEIQVEKHIPMGAGLGGGSSDAATVLKALNKLSPLPKKKLVEIAQQIGSDVPFFLQGGMALVQEKGEKIEPLSLHLEKTWFLVIYPNIHVSTAKAYSWIKNFDKEQNRTFLKKKHGSSVDFLEKIMYNTFQKFVFQHLPRLKSIYEKLRSLLHSTFGLMSGSGSSFFFVYEDFSRAMQDLDTLKEMEDFSSFSFQLCEPVYPEAVSSKASAEADELI